MVVQHDAAVAGPVRVCRQLRKWENGRKPSDGPPDDVDERCWWEQDGAEIESPSVVAVLEARYAAAKEG